MSTMNFNARRNELFALLFELQWQGKQVWEHIRDGKLTATPAFEGELYRESNIKIMFVGRDLNGWNEALGDCSTLEKTVTSVINQEGAFDTFVDERGFGDGPRKYYHKNSKFFRFIKQVLEFVGESDKETDETWYQDSKRWNQRFVWANLYCISPRNPPNMNEAHPDNEMVKLGIDSYVDLMELYIKHYKPDVVIFITDVYGWFIRWKRKKSFKSFVSNYSETLQNNTIVVTGNVDDTEIIVCKRPDARGYSYEKVKNMANIIAEYVLQGKA